MGDKKKKPSADANATPPVPDDVKPSLSEEIQQQTNSEKKKRTRTTKKKPNFELESDLQVFIDLPFQTVLPPALTEEERKTLATALSRWIEKRMGFLGEYSVDLALAGALFAIVLPRTNLLNILMGKQPKDAKPNNLSNGEKGDG